MGRFTNSLQAVLWAAIGLGGRKADADQRVESASLALIVVLAVVLVLGLIAGLVAVAHIAAS